MQIKNIGRQRNAIDAARDQHCRCREQPTTTAVSPQPRPWRSRHSVQQESEPETTHHGGQNGPFVLLDQISGQRAHSREVPADGSLAAPLNSFVAHCGQARTRAATLQQPVSLSTRSPYLRHNFGVSSKPAMSNFGGLETGEPHDRVTSLAPAADGALRQLCTSHTLASVHTLAELFDSATGVRYCRLK